MAKRQRFWKGKQWVEDGKKHVIGDCYVVSGRTYYSHSVNGVYKMLITQEELDEREYQKTTS